MSEQLKQELEADTDRLETGTVTGSETIGEQEEKPAEGKLEAQEDDESKEEDTVPMGKASLADIASGIPAPTKEEVEAAEAENAKPIKQKAREKLEAEKKKSQETKDKPQISEKPVKKDAASKQRKTEKTSTKSSELSGQMSLFDLL